MCDWNITIFVKLNATGNKLFSPKIQYKVHHFVENTVFKISITRIFLRQVDQLKKNSDN